MSDKCGAAVAEARRVLELDKEATPGKWFAAGFDATDDFGKERSNEFIVSDDDIWICQLMQEDCGHDQALMAEYRILAPSLARYVLAADAALAAQTAALQDAFVILEGLRISVEWELAPSIKKKIAETAAKVSDAVRLTAEARGK